MTSRFLNGVTRHIVLGFKHGPGSTFGNKENVFSLEHVGFEMFVRHSSGAVQ